MFVILKQGVYECDTGGNRWTREGPVVCWGLWECCHSLVCVK
jgi:hypothetical protein